MIAFISYTVKNDLVSCWEHKLQTHSIFNSYAILFKHMFRALLYCFLLYLFFISCLISKIIYIASKMTNKARYISQHTGINSDHEILLVLHLMYM